MTDEERYARNRNRALLVLAALLIGLALWSGCGLGAFQGAKFEIGRGYHTSSVKVRVFGDTGAPLAGASCQSETADGVTDANGLVVLKVPDGTRVVTCLAPGYQRSSTAPFSAPNVNEMQVWMRR